MQIIAYNLNGKIQTAHPVSSLQDAIALLPESVQYQIIDSENLPSPETRDRWILTENGIEVGEAPPVVPTDRNYRAFFFALLTSSSYQHVLFHSAQNIACNTAMTVFIASMNALMNKVDETPEQWAGLQNAFQASVNQLVAALNEAQVPFSAEHIAEIQAMRSGAGLIFTLPGEG